MRIPKEKKPTYALLILMLILGMTMVDVNVSADPQLPKLFVDPPTYTASLLGETFTIDINISNIQDLWGFEFRLVYNTTLLDVLDAVQGPFPPEPRSIIINESAGYVYVYGTCESAEGNGTMLAITFNVTYAETVSCTLDLCETKLFDYWGNDIDHDVEDGNYNFVVLDISVTTDKLLYYQGETVEIHGNLTLDSEPYQGLVAIEVVDPNGYRMVVRTVKAGPNPPPGEITITDLYPCNLLGQFNENFNRGGKAYFYTNVTNDGTVTQDVTVTINAYDKDMVPLGGNSFGPWPVAPGYGIDAIFEILIPEWASLGNGTVYASALTNLPRYGGSPHCPEKSATFIIIGSSGGAAAPETQTSETVGNYSLTFKLRIHDVAIGNYTVYASSGILKQRTTSVITFEMYLFGDVDGDGDVDGGDIRKIQLAMLSHPGDPNWNPNADVDGDGDVDGGDIRKTQLHLLEG